VKLVNKEKLLASCFLSLFATPVVMLITGGLSFIFNAMKYFWQFPLEVIGYVGIDILAHYIATTLLIYWILPSKK